MCVRLRALWRNTTNKVCERRGDALLLCMAILVVLFCIFLVFYEKWRVYNVALEVSRKVNTTITSLASSHLNDSYSPIRDGTSGAFVFDGISFQEITDDAFLQKYNQLYANTQLSGDALRGGVNGDKQLYEISNVSVMVSNAGASGGETWYRVEYDLTIPQDFVWREKQVILEQQVQKVRYLNKF